MGNDDIAGAYWVATSLAAQGIDPPVAPPLLKAVQGTRWLSPESNRYALDLFAVNADIERPNDDYANVLLAFAASLLPSIMAPQTNLLGWLPEPNRLPEFEAIVSPVRAFGNYGHPLLPQYISGDEGKQDLQAQIDNACAAAGRWLEESSQFHHNFARADNVFRHVSGSDGLLFEMLTIVSDNRRNEIDTVMAYTNNLSQDAYVDELVDQTDRNRAPNRKRIVGDAKAWLVRRIHEAKGLADRWCELVLRDTVTPRREPASRLLEQVSTLRSQLRIEAPGVRDALLALAADSDQPGIAASARCTARSLQQLCDYLKLGIQNDLDPVPQVVHDLEMINSLSGSTPAVEDRP